MTKITVRFAPALYDAFSAYIAGLPVRRDAFIETVLRAELPRLDEAMEGKELKPEARRYIAKALQDRVREKKSDMVIVNMMIDDEVAGRLQNRVKQSKMCRDAFFNRLLMLLVSRPGVLKWIKTVRPLEVEERTDDVWDEPVTVEPTSPMKAVHDLLTDPLGDLHRIAGQNLWSMPLPAHLHGLSCWIEEMHVPKTKAFRKLERMMQDPDKFLAFDASSLAAASVSEGDR